MRPASALEVRAAAPPLPAVLGVGAACALAVLLRFALPPAPALVGFAAASWS
jgi:hypothetical protein